jgi:hypothetical protein
MHVLTCVIRHRHNLGFHYNKLFKCTSKMCFTRKRNFVTVHKKFNFLIVHVEDVNLA